MLSKIDFLTARLFVLPIVLLSFAPLARSIGAQPSGAGDWSWEYEEADWDTAKAKCASARLRLPTFSELNNAYKMGITRGWKKSGYWSLTEAFGNNAMSVDMTNGNAVSSDKTSRKSFRCLGWSIP